MANQRIDQLATANNAAINNNTKIPIDANGVMMSANVGQIKDKILGQTKTINGQSINGVGDITISGSTMSPAGETTVIAFTASKHYGTSGDPVAGNISYNLVNATTGSKQIIFHYDSVEPLFPVGTFKLDNSIYVPNALNIIELLYISNDTILVQIYRTTNIGLTPEVQKWLDKGGVASGFMLTALNQFMLDIASIRSKILRFNPLFGETFASAFIPLIVNDDGSNTPLGTALDANYGFVSGDYAAIGSNGGLIQSPPSIKYIDIGFIPNSISQFGLNDCSLGFISIGNADSQSEFGTNLNLNSGNDSGIKATSKTVALNGNLISLGSGYETSNPKIVTRNSSTSISVYFQGNKSTGTNNSTTKSTTSLKLGKTTYINYIARYAGGYFIGKGLTDSDELTLRTAWVALLTKTARI